MTDVCFSQIFTGVHENILIQIIGPNSGRDRDYKTLLNAVGAGVRDDVTMGDAISPVKFSRRICRKPDECEVEYLDDCLRRVEALTRGILEIVYGGWVGGGVEVC